jgi:hypothetical protein
VSQHTCPVTPVSVAEVGVLAVAILILSLLNIGPVDFKVNLVVGV